MRLKVAIVGAGIGGLTAAIALRAERIDVHVYEQATTLGEIGAGVAVAANGSRLLHGLGLRDALERVAAVPERVEFRHWRTGAPLFEHPMGSWYRQRFGAPMYTVHRADLHRALTERYDGPLTLGRRCVGLTESATGVELSFADGTSARAHVAVGADGVHSVVRRHVTGPDEAVFSGKSGFRGLVPAQLAPEFGDSLGLWLGPGRHIVAYPVRGGSLINVLAVVPDPQWTLESWTARGEVSEAVAAFDGWHPAVTGMLAAVEQTARWALYDREPLRRWSCARVTLLGDAAHAMLPHHGQGANQSIEDAVTLARFLAAGSDVTQSLQGYEAVRRPRARQLQVRSRATAACYHLPDGPEADERNARFADLPDDVAWIHGHDASAGLPARADGHSTFSV